MVCNSHQALMIAKNENIFIWQGPRRPACIVECACMTIRLPGIPTETPGGSYVYKSVVLDFREKLGAEKNLREGRHLGLTYGCSAVTIRQPLPMMLTFTVI